MLKKELEEQVSFKVDDKIYEIADYLYMHDFTNNREFCEQLENLVYFIEQNKDAHLQSTIDEYLSVLLDTDFVEDVNNFLYSLLGVNTVIFLKCKNRLPLTAYEISIIEHELKVLVYETEKKCESKAV